MWVPVWSRIVCPSGSMPTTSPSNTSVFDCDARIERIGAAMSAGFSPAVAT